MKSTNTFAILAIIFAVLFPLLGLIFGIISLVQISKSKDQGKTLAICAIMLSIITLIGSITLITFLIKSGFYFS